MGKADQGKIGCGCLLFVLVPAMVMAGLMIHPISLKFLAGRFHYQDKIVPCDVLFVPRTVEDKNGEVYTEAFKEYWSGEGKAIWVEEDRVFGLSLRDIVAKQAKDRGIKEDIVKAVQLEGEDAARAGQLKAICESKGLRKVIIVVPEYASRRSHLLYKSGSPDSVLFLVKPVAVSYFKPDKWWRNDVSRAIMGREVYGTMKVYVDQYRPGSKEGEEKKRKIDGQS